MGQPAEKIVNICRATIAELEAIPPNLIAELIGGLKGAILGAAIGAGGAIAATDGKDINLPAGSIVRIRVDTPVRVAG